MSPNTCNDISSDWTGSSVKCLRPATHGNTCIFHADASTKNVADFHEKLKEEVAIWQQNKTEAWSFVGFIFPDRIDTTSFLDRCEEDGLPCFPVDMDFSNAQFYGSVELKASFDGNVRFGRAVFYESVNFKSSIFAKDAAFWYSSFRGDVWFESAVIRGNAFFMFCRFSKYAWFPEVHCDGLTWFEHAVFQGNTQFNRAKFRGGIGMPNATFLDVCEFHETEFRRLCNFEYCSFAEAGSFLRSLMCGPVKFKWPGTGKKIISDSLTDGPSYRSRGILIFDDIRHATDSDSTIDNEIGSAESVLDLRKNNLSSDSSLRIQNCKRMDLFLLEGVDSSRIEFYNNKWIDTRDRFFFGLLSSKRQVCGDELCLGGDAEFRSTPGQIRITYHQLAKRYRDDLNLPQAVEFDRGAFEMRRLEARSERGVSGISNYTWLTLYKYVSHYSGSLILPFAWYVCVVCLFAAIFGAIDSEHLWWQPWKILSGYRPDYSHVADKLLLSWRTSMSLTSVGGEVFGEKSAIIRTLQALEWIISLGFATLFVFSLRRRIKH